MYEGSTARQLLAALWDELLNALAVAGLVRIGEEDGRVVWPVRWGPWHWWVAVWAGGLGPRAGVFRNLPGVVKDVPGRWLPRRWGFYLLGFELGDRGGGGKLVLRQGGRPRVVGAARVYATGPRAHDTGLTPAQLWSADVAACLECGALVKNRRGPVDTAPCPASGGTATVSLLADVGAVERARLVLVALLLAATAALYVALAGAGVDLARLVAP